MPLIRAFVVDDERLAVQRLSRLLAETGRVVVAGSATDPHEALEALGGTDVDVAFLDIQMPAMTGLELVEKLNRGITVGKGARQARASSRTRCDGYSRAGETAGARAGAGPEARACRFARRRAHDGARRRKNHALLREGQADVRRVRRS